MRKHNNNDADGGRNRGRPGRRSGLITDVAREATQNNGLPTWWSGRLTAMVADPKCDLHQCRLYVGAAAAGLAHRQRARPQPALEGARQGAGHDLDRHALIDPTDKSGHTIYVGTGEPSGSGDSEAGLGLYKSTDRGEHWKLVPGSYAVANDRGIGEIAVDPKNPRHIFMGTTVARHAGSGVPAGASRRPALRRSACTSPRTAEPASSCASTCRRIP